MTKDKLYSLIQDRPLYLDGATGSNLQKAGMPTGVCPEKWILEHPDILINLQKQFIEAGTQILLTPTFSGNRLFPCRQKIFRSGLRFLKAKPSYDTEAAAKEISGNL